MNLSHSKKSQLSLMPLFANFDHEHSAEYNNALDVWNEKFGQYATLLTFKPSITAKSQSVEQSAALRAAVADPLKLADLLKIDTGFGSLNNQLRRYISGALLANADAEFSAISKNSEAKRNQEQSEAKAYVHSQQEKLRLLELREKLLAHESEFTSEKAAQQSTLIKQAKELADIKPVITKKSLWIWADNQTANLMRFDQVIFDKNGKSESGHFVYSYALTFEEVAA